MSQERKSSGNFQKADIENFHRHNFRITKPSYLLPNEFVTLKNHTVLFHDFNEVFDEQLKIWKSKNKRGGRPPQKANCLQEIVINLKADSKIDDLITISNYIKREYGYIPLEIAIHNDEGFVDKNGKAHYNYHAHIDFCTLQDGIQWCQMEHYCDKVEYTKKDGTKSWRFVSNKDSKLQDFIAETLGMERGQKGSKAKRLEHEQYRQVAQQKQVLTDKIDELNKINKLHHDLFQQYIQQFDITDEEIANHEYGIVECFLLRGIELKQLRADKENQLKEIELLKKKRGVLNKGAKSYRQQKKTLKQEISKLNNNITDLEKTIQSLQADKADLQSQLETAKGQILSDTQKADFLNKTINDFIEQGQLYTKKQYDNKEVTKTEVKLRDYTADEIENLDRVKDLKEKLEKATAQIPTDQDKADLIENAIKTKIEQGDLFTKEQYDNKPLTQKMIKDYIEKNRLAMRQQGIYTASDYKQLTQLKADLISELKLAKSGELQLTNDDVKFRIKTLMTNLTARATKAEDDLTTATNDLATANDKIATLENENGMLTKLNDMLQKAPINPAQKPKPKAEPILKTKPNLVGFENIGQKSSRTWESILDNTSTHESEVDSLKTQPNSNLSISDDRVEQSNNLTVGKSVHRSR